MERSWLRPLAVFGLGCVFVAATPGATLAQSGARRSLVVSGSAAQVYEDEVPLDLNLPISNFGSSAGWSTLFTGDATYSQALNRVRVSTTAATSLRHYNRLGELRVVSGTGAAGLSASLSRRTALSVNQTVSYTPSDLYGLFPQQSDPGSNSVVQFSPIHVIDDRESLSYSTTLGVTHQVSRRARISVAGDTYRTRYFREITTDRDTQQFGLTGQYSLQLSRNTAFRTDYHYRRGDFGVQYVSVQATDAEEHSLQAGIDYQRPLSATRKMAFGFLGGSSVVDPTSPTPTLSESHRGLSGSAYLNYQFTREWQLRGTYRRGVEYVAGVAEALLADSGSLIISGLPRRRLNVDAMVGYSTGASALARSSLQYDTYTGTVRVSHSFWRSLNVFGEYVYYYYDLRDVAQTGTPTPTGATRNVAHVGVSFRTPLVSR